MDHTHSLSLSPPVPPLPSPATTQIAKVRVRMSGLLSPTTMFLTNVRHISSLFFIL